MSTMAVNVLRRSPKLCSEEEFLMFFISFAAVIEVRIMAWPDHVALMEETINAEMIILEGSRPLAKQRYRW